MNSLRKESGKCSLKRFHARILTLHKTQQLHAFIGREAGSRTESKTSQESVFFYWCYLFLQEHETADAPQYCAKLEPQKNSLQFSHLSKLDKNFDNSKKSNSIVTN
ncbi:hypothetical protein TNCV_2948321 [Trichonephila clavipes]|nr:hypothetical protein TNCV_2948321 [Trichonephila clavipes]